MTTDDKQNHTPYNHPLRARFDEDFLELIIEGVSAGPAGAVEIRPAPDVSVSFDAATGLVSEITVAPRLDSSHVGYDDASLDVLSMLFGKDTARNLGELTDDQELSSNILVPDHAKLGSLYRLALLETAQILDPLYPESPLWDAEAVLIAHRGGFSSLAQPRALSLVERFVALVELKPQLLADKRVLYIGSVLIGLSERSSSASATESISLWRHLSSEMELSNMKDQIEEALSSVGDQMFALAGALSEPKDPSRQLLARIIPFVDLARLPEDTFVLGPGPQDDLSIALDGNQILVRVRLDQRARKSRVEACHFRLVDADESRALAQGSLILGESTSMRREAHATIEVPQQLLSSQPRTLWLEVTDDIDSPVSGPEIRHLRRGFRYGAMALRALRHPSALEPGWDSSDWNTEASALWAKAAGELSSAKDTARSAVARAYRNPPKQVSQELPEWAGTLIQAGVHREAPFVAEDLFVTPPQRSNG